MGRYELGVTSTTDYLMPGARPLVMAADLSPLSAVEVGDNLTVTIAFVHNQTGDATVTLAETGADIFASSLAADMATISQTGVSVSGTTITVGPTATSPITFTRAIDAEGTATLMLTGGASALIGTAAQSATATDMGGGEGDPLDAYLAAEFLMNEGAGQVLTNQITGTPDALLGSASTDTTADPAWEATGLAFAGNPQHVRLTSAFSNSLTGLQPIYFFAVVQHDSSATEDQQIISRDSGVDDAQFQLVITTADRLKMVRRAAGSSFSVTNAESLPANTWGLVTGWYDSANVYVQLGDGPIAQVAHNNAAQTPTGAADLGRRRASGGVNFLKGRIAYISIADTAMDEPTREACKDRARAAVAAKGITV